MIVLIPTLRSEDAIKPGDHVAIIGNTFADQLRTNCYLELLLMQRTKGQLSVRNLGWAGDTLDVRNRPTNFPKEVQTLTDHKTDIIIACFGMGESFAGEKGIKAFSDYLKKFIAFHRGKTYNGKSPVKLILISPIAYENLGFRTPGVDLRNRHLSDYTDVMSQIAAENKITFVNAFKWTQKLMKEESAPKLTTNGIHLNNYGFWGLSRMMADTLIDGADGWKLELDAISLKATATGVFISDLKGSVIALNFTVKEESWASPLPPLKGSIHKLLYSQRDRLVIKNLKAGTYQLLVDDKAILKASHKEWEQGVFIDGTPAHQAVDVYRQAIVDKNQHFIYSWKALNQVHIVGERKSSPSGKNLPAEVKEFNKITIQKDAALKSGVALKTREWQIKAVK
jgi:hypothetical protein